MDSITITLPDQSKHSLPAGITLIEVAEKVNPHLKRESIAAKVNSVLYDLNAIIKEDAKIEFIKSDTEIGHDVLLHSTAHLMAQAVKILFPDAKVTIGPAIENRFYYDFDVETPFTENDLKLIEQKMHQLSSEKQKVLRMELSKDEAIQLFTDMNEPYKLEIIDQIESEDKISAYQQNLFIDLCRGPHVPHTGKIKYFKLLYSSSAYWRGDENNKVLQRIYGTAFSSKKALKSYLLMLEEAKKRDHRKLGKELELFTFDDEVGPGLPLWLPKGATIVEELETLAKETEQSAGYVRVRSPHLTKGELYKKSGHLEHYESSMFPAMEIDGIEYYVKPMNCPHHHKIYSSSPKSYRDLPLRMAEYGTCYRYEKSGQLFGLMRVRSMQMNDAHIYCMEDQFQDEFLAVCKLYLKYFKIFGIEKYKMRLSVHDSEGLGKKYVDEPELWKKTEESVRSALIKGNIEFVEVKGEAAFYGPKVDVQVWSAIGKEFTLATNQVDFAIPKRFDLTYITSSGQEKTPICIHRAPLSTHERFIGFLIEHFGGNFPLWLAPIQVAVLSISEKTEIYAEEVYSELKHYRIRTVLNNKPDKIGAKIREAELSKINVMLIIGAKEQENLTVMVRRKFSKEQKEMKISEVVNSLTTEIKQRRVNKSQT
ncbi:MAG: threonine--tRNA ligase [Candidatus Marinimicrobia bacterium]|nr:threonine--tRNA ligase [Candidatus Neomarinimicrobiota bacterium]|tara:strand:- start:7744 stop:9696 length:1953 start_codon:yes stop_codon:yes gene_type:complete